MNVSSIPTTRINKDHPIELIIGDLHSAPLTRRMSQQNLKEHCLVSYINKKRRTHHKDYQNCLFACFLSQKKPKKARGPIGTKWVFRNKKDDRGIVVKNKERLVAQGYTQEEGIDYDEVFALVARIEAISFEDLHFHDKVYKVEKALYGLHQAPRAWYKTLSTYLLENRFRRGIIDKTLFIKKDKSDILSMQVYVDDIIFGSTKKTLCLQVQQKEDGIFISQDKYVADILKKFDYVTIKTASTPMEPNKALVKDEEADNVDVHLYRSMIGSLMYLTSSRPDITFVVSTCARFQVTPKTSHLHAVNRIFRYLKGQPKLGLWYPRDSPFDLEAFSDSDYVGASLDRKSTTRGCQFLVLFEGRLIMFICSKEWMEGNVTSLYETMLLQYQAEVGEGPKKPRQAKRGRDTKIPQSGGPPEKVGDEAVHKELGDRMERAATTVSCLEAKQDSDAQTRFEIASKKSYDPPLSRVNTFGSGEDNMKLLELIEICTKLSDLVKIVNEEAQIQALVDRKKVIVTETSIRRALHLQDAEGIDCLPNATIFAELERMGAKTTAWNEFCSTIASAIICLATNQQFNFFQVHFDNMVKNLEGGVKFLMYPRFVQVFLNKQVEGMFKHKETYDIPSHSKKVFANMKRPGNKFSGRITPLFHVASDDRERFIQLISMREQVCLD
ncbi:putative ribonuclease H-like domain-containing protein [Tanacetum coccineum]